MSWTQVLCLSLQLLSYATSEYATLVQSTPLLNVSPGATAQFHCEVKNAKPETLNMNWIRQTPGQRPEGVLSYTSDEKIYRAPNITDCFVPSRNMSNYFLNISNVQVEDDSVYYCFHYNGSTGDQTWGDGTRLQVNGGDRRRPRVSLFAPAQEEIKDSGNVIFICHINGFSPKHHPHVHWQMDGKERSQGVQEGQAVLGEDHTYSQSFHLNIPAKELNNESMITCVVKHKALENSLETSITYGDSSPLQ